MTSIAYHQYCNISYNGGSYVCSPIKGPLSTSQTPGTIENKNRGITYAQNGQPVKDANCNNESSNSQDRRMFKEMVITIPGRLQQKLMGAYDASERSSLLRTIAVGTSGFNKANQALSFKSVHVQDSNRALNKLRRVGGAVPPKVQAKILPASTSVANVRDNAHLQQQSKNSPNVKLSVFMPRHLRSRIECTTGCDGGEIAIDNINHNASGSDAVTGSNEATSYETLSSMNTFVVGKDNDGNNVIFINTISPILTNTRNISPDFKKYGLGEGSYLFSNVDKDYAFTILNHNKEYLIKITGDDDKMFTKKVFGITYTFYYGDVVLDVIDNFGIVSMYTYNYEYAGAEYGLVYGEHYTTETNGLIPLMKDGNQITINQDEEKQTGFYYRISSPPHYNQGNLLRQQYGLGIGKYLFSYVPKSLAFTLLNADNDGIYLSSDSFDNNETLSKTIDGKKYTFHHGKVTINVDNDFKYVDLVPYNKDFKIAKYTFKFHPSFTIIPPPTTENTSDLLESDDTTLPDMLYSYNAATYYTFYSTAIIIRPLTNVDVSKFIKFTIEPSLPGWLTFNEENGYITGYTINPEDAFYLRKYIVFAHLPDSSVKKYPLHIVIFNQESIINPSFCNYDIFVKTPENEYLYDVDYPQDVPRKSSGCFGASILRPNIIITKGDLKTVILNEYSSTTIWANDNGFDSGYLVYPIGININVQAPSGWTIYVGQFGRVQQDDGGYHGQTTPLKELSTTKETITDFITFMNNFVGTPGAPNYQKLYYPPYSIGGEYNAYTYRIYAKKN